MKIVVVGGHSRNIGKTSVMAGLIRDTRSLNWTAVKITQYGHGICSRDGEPCGCAPSEHAFVLTEENDREGRGDTSRFLAAGARRAFWLRARQGQVGEAYPLLADALAGDGAIMIESNSILKFLNPSFALMVLDSSQEDFKPSAREFLRRSDGLALIGNQAEVSSAWPGVDPRVIAEKPTFHLPAGQFSSPALTRFVLRRLEGASETDPPKTTSHPDPEKEQLCQR